MLSSGFDAGHLDWGNVRNDEGIVHHGINLSTADYKYLTQRLVEVATLTSNGRVVSVLEGGYGTMCKGSATLNRDNLAKNVISHIDALVGR